MEKTMQTGKVGKLGAGSRFAYGGVEAVILDARLNMVLALTADVLKDANGNVMYIPFDTDNKNDFAASSIRAYLNGEFLQRMVEAGADAKAFVPMEIDLTSEDGLDDYGKDTAKIGLISCDKYRFFRSVIPNASYDWWTCTPFSTVRSGYSCNVRNVNTSGALDSNNAYNGRRGVRPLFCLKSDTPVSYDESEITERAPSFAEMIMEGVAQGLQEAFPCSDMPEEEQPAAEQPNGESGNRAEAVDMMKHIAAAFEIPATIDAVPTGGTSLDDCHAGLLECVRAAQKQFTTTAAKHGIVDSDGLSSIVRAYEALIATGVTKARVRPKSFNKVGKSGAKK